MDLKGGRGGLLVLGMVGETIYLLLAVRLPWWRYGGTLQSWSQLLGQAWPVLVACLAVIGLLAAAYLSGWRRVRRGGDHRSIVWGFAFLYAATLFWLLPITSDLFTYLSHAHLFTDLAVSPLLVAPLSSLRDRFLTAYPTIYAFKPSAYGPAWILLSAPGTLGPYDVVGGLLYLKGLSAIAYLGSAWLLEQILRQVRPESALEGLYLFAWNPLVLLMAVGDGHNDAVMMALVLLAFWLALRERWALSFAALTLSAWIKYMSFLFFPFFVLYAWKRLAGRRLRDALPAQIGGPLAVLGVSVLVIVPFWSRQIPAGIVDRLLRPVNWSGAGSGLSTQALAVGLLLFSVAYLVLAWRLARGRGSFQQLANAGFVASLLVFVLAAARSQPWHLIWPAALAGLSDRRWAWPVVAGLAILMLTVQVWVEWGAPGL